MPSWPPAWLGLPQKMPRMQCGHHRSATSALAQCSSAACGRSFLCASRSSPGIRSGLEATRAGASRVVLHTEQDLPMKCRADRDRTLHAAVVRPLPGDRRIPARERAHDDYHDRRRVSLLLRVGLHGGTRGLIEQSGFRHHDFDHPVRGRGADVPDGPRCTAWPGRGHHDRCRGVLCGLSRRRQSARPQGWPAGGCDALAPAGDACSRRRVLRADNGTGTQPARARLWHRRSERGTSAAATGSTSNADGVCIPGHVWRRAAVVDGLDRRGHRRSHHRYRYDSQGARRHGFVSRSWERRLESTCRSNTPCRSFWVVC